MSLADLGMTDATAELSEDVITKLVRKGRVPVVQYDLRADPPIIKGRQLARDQLSGYAIFVIQTEKRPSLIVTDPEHPKILDRPQLPKDFIDFLTKSDSAIKRVWARER